nr:uncharacterized protein CTRU02_00782 [Colletotrichum truncatum]KAF6802033.1 hypothetical protein CTRU02_00782 [Colletotrichum truncatum]
MLEEVHIVLAKKTRGRSREEVIEALQSLSSYSNKIGHAINSQRDAPRDNAVPGPFNHIGFIATRGATAGCDANPVTVTANQEPRLVYLDKDTRIKLCSLFFDRFINNATDNIIELVSTSAYSHAQQPAPQDIYNTSDGIPDVIRNIARAFIEIFTINRQSTSVAFLGNLRSIKLHRLFKDIESIITSLSENKVKEYVNSNFSPREEGQNNKTAIITMLAKDLHRSFSDIETLVNHAGFAHALYTAWGRGALMFLPSTKIILYNNIYCNSALLDVMRLLSAIEGTEIFAKLAKRMEEDIIKPFMSCRLMGFRATKRASGSVEELIEKVKHLDPETESGEDFDIQVTDVSNY